MAIVEMAALMLLGLLLGLSQTVHANVQTCAKDGIYTSDQCK